jgi:cell fate (sporulation/competence/biofilm development) regulator YlbF (YheA/YmcA/DUF963 family)
MHTPLSNQMDKAEALLSNLHARAETTELGETEQALMEILDEVVAVVAELAKHRWTKIV